MKGPMVRCAHELPSPRASRRLLCGTTDFRPIMCGSHSPPSRTAKRQARQAGVELVPSTTKEGLVKIRNDSAADMIARRRAHQLHRSRVARKWARDVSDPQSAPMDLRPLPLRGLYSHRERSLESRKGSRGAAIFRTPRSVRNGPECPNCDSGLFQTRSPVRY